MMQMFKERKLAVWVIAIILSSMVLVFGIDSATPDPPRPGYRYIGGPPPTKVAPIIYSLMVITVILGTAYFLTYTPKEPK